MMMKKPFLDTVRNVVLAAGLALTLGGTAVLAQTNAPSDNTTKVNQTPTFCNTMAQRLGGLPIPNGEVCDVVIVRKSPAIIGADGMNLNKFTLMNSVLEFTTTGMPENEVYVMGDFALTESELNRVLPLMTEYQWTITGSHNHMIHESPKLAFVHWEARGNTDNIVNGINWALAQTTIK